MSQFSEMVQRHFGFLGKHGYKVEVKSDQRIQYLSSNALIELFCSDRGEVDLTLDQNPPKHRFQLRLFLMAFHPDEEKRLGECIASNPTEVDLALSKLSSILTRCGMPLIQGDPKLFEHMATVKWWELPGYAMERKPETTMTPKKAVDVAKPEGTSDNQKTLL